MAKFGLHISTWFKAADLHNIYVNINRRVVTIVAGDTVLWLDSYGKSIVPVPM